MATVATAAANRAVMSDAARAAAAAAGMPSSGTAAEDFARASKLLTTVLAAVTSAPHAAISAGMVLQVCSVSRPVSQYLTLCSLTSACFFSMKASLFFARRRFLWSFAFRNLIAFCGRSRARGRWVRGDTAVHVIRRPRHACAGKQSRDATMAADRCRQAKPGPRTARHRFQSQLDCVA